MKPEEVNPQNFKVNRIIYTSQNNDFSIAESEFEKMESFASLYDGRGTSMIR